MMPRSVAFFVLLVGLAAPVPANAKSSKSFTYPFSALWSTTVRFIRADRGYPIKDKDEEAGYILFTFPGEGAVKECSAALEIVPHVDEDGFQRIRVQLNIAHQPTYVEVYFLDLLERKLREEQGEPPPAKKRDSAPPPVPPKKPADKKPEG